MWIAKNSLNGKTYGRSYSSIYDCQRFIDTDLQILEYHYRSIEKIENHLIDETKFFKWFAENYPNSHGNVGVMITARIQYALNDFMDISDVRSNNVIRCWYIEQKRFACGMDF